MLPNEYFQVSIFIGKNKSVFDTPIYAIAIGREALGKLVKDYLGTVTEDSRKAMEMFIEGRIDAKTRVYITGAGDVGSISFVHAGIVRRS